MAAKLQTIVNILEEYAPPALAEDWDNSGLQLGNSGTEVQRVLIALDINKEVVKEALEKKVQLIISHHPLLFKPIKNILFNTPKGELLVELIKNNISVYSAHTSLDKASRGVNDVLARLLKLTDLKLLSVTDREQYYKLVVFVPLGYEDSVREALAGAGAGFVGNYSDCAFFVAGTGMFKPLEETNPFIGEYGKLTKTEEIRLETIIPASQSSKIIQDMLKVHPYEEAAFDLYPLKNQGAARGLGIVGNLTEPVTMMEFVENVKQLLDLDTVKSGGSLSRIIKRVAVCGGSGSNLWRQAVRQKADVFVTADISYHTAQEMLDSKLSFIDAGHYATERPVLDRLGQFLNRCSTERQLGLEVIISEINTDPFIYV